MKTYGNGTQIESEDYSALVDYRSALQAKDNAPFETLIWHEANKIVEALKGREVTYYVKCMLCGESFDFTVPVFMAAGYHDAPRGICGKHSGPVTAVVS